MSKVMESDIISGGEGLWLSERGWSYGKTSVYGELKAWCTTRQASHAAMRLLSGKATVVAPPRSGE